MNLGPDLFMDDNNIIVEDVSEDFEQDAGMLMNKTYSVFQLPTFSFH